MATVRGRHGRGRSRIAEARTASDVRGVLAYGGALGITGVLTYGVTALIGRRLGPDGFPTIGLAVLFALPAPTIALLGGAAMAAARKGRVPNARWYGPVAAAALGMAILVLLPIPAVPRATAWLGVAVAASLLSAWNRGALIGLGRLWLVAASLVLESAARLGFVALLVALGWRSAGAWAGVLLGAGFGVVVTHLFLPRESRPALARVPQHVILAIGGLVFLGLIQFADLLAVRVAAPRDFLRYAVASSVTKLALYAQLPAAAYALRRAAAASARLALRRVALLALAPAGAVLVAMELLPGRILALAFGHRWVGAASLVRTLAPAMVLSGMVLVLAHLLMGGGRISWVWTAGLVGLPGLAAVLAEAGSPSHEAVAMIVVQAALVATLAAHARRLLRAEGRTTGGVVILNWRDGRNAIGGGGEVFVEGIARGLAAAGRPVTIFCAEHEDAPRDETVDGVRFLRRGSWRTVYLWAAAYHLMGRFGPHDAVIDVQNGIPFLAPMYCGGPVVAMVHHVCGEQWGMAFGARVARAGWWVESRLSPRVYREAPFVAVSEATSADLTRLGIDPERISVVRNACPIEVRPGGRLEAAAPTIAYLGRLVPHKRVELLLEAAAILAREFPDLRVRIIGRGPCGPDLEARSARLGLQGAVSFEGFVDQAAKARILGEAWVLGLPSAREGWGIAVMEAAAFETPTVAFRVGGLVESVVDGRTGLLASSFDDFVRGLRVLLQTTELRRSMGAAAADQASRFTWATAIDAMEDVIAREIALAQASGASTPERRSRGQRSPSPARG